MVKENTVAAVIEAPRSMESVAVELASLMREIKNKKAAIVREYIELGRLWKRIRDGKLWMAQDGVNSFREFCEKEGGFSHSWIYGAIRVADSFGELVDSNPVLLEMDHSRLPKLLQVAEDGADDMKLDWLHKAAQNSKKDFENNLREARGKQPTDTCDHPEDQLDDWKHCRKCDDWIPVKVKSKKAA